MRLAHFACLKIEAVFGLCGSVCLTFLTTLLQKESILDIEVPALHSTKVHNLIRWLNKCMIRGLKTIEILTIHLPATGAKNSMWYPRIFPFSSFMIAKKLQQNWQGTSQDTIWKGDILNLGPRSNMMIKSILIKGMSLETKALINCLRV